MGGNCPCATVHSLLDPPLSRERRENSVVQVCAQLGREIVKGALLCYKRIVSPLLGPTCRFYPSCSSYALMAVEKYGVMKGIGLALLRLAKCHPWHPGGIDPLR
jgi:putative membrane protein insertion efficiency factor